MKEVHETVVLDVPGNSHHQHLHGNGNFQPMAPGAFPSHDSGVVGGEAPMDVEKEDENTSAPQGWCYEAQY